MISFLISDFWFESRVIRSGLHISVNGINDMNPQAVIALLLIIVTPTIQIVLLTMKFNGHIKTPAGVIAILAFLLGIGLSLVSMKVVESDVHPNPSGARCGIIPFSFLFMGILITLIATPAIELIFSILRGIKKKRT